MINTNDLRQGDYARLVDFGQTDMLYRHKLLALGMTRGVIIRVVRIAPMGCPIQLEVRGTALVLRINEACHLRWERVFPENKAMVSEKYS